MIHESGPWKRELLRDADLLERWANKPMSERRSILFERKVFLSAFSMRKLFEARRLSTSFRDRVVKVGLLPSMGKRVTRLNNHHIDRQYAVDAPEISNLSAVRLIDLIIHSYTFVECLGEAHRIEAFLIASDRTRQTGLYEVELAAYLTLMRWVGFDDPEVTVFTFDDQQGDYKVWSGPAKAPK